MKKRMMAAALLALAALNGCGGDMRADAGLPKDATGHIEKNYAPPEPEGELFVSAMSEQEFMTVAANQFMAKYPKVKVTINAYRGMSTDPGPNPPDEYKTENYRNYLNTKIMTGKAEDIIFTAHLPVKKYADMGVFEDLSQFLSVAPEINPENFFMNALEAPKDSKGKIYVLPLTSSFMVASFDSRLVSEADSRLDEGMTSTSFEKAAAYAQQLVDGTAKKNAYVAQHNPTSFFSYLIKDSLNEFVDAEHKRASVDTERYVNLLNHTKGLVDRGYFSAKNSIDFYNMEYYFALYIQNEFQAAFFSLGPDPADSCALPLSDSGGKVYANPNNSLGINSASKNKTLAWEFVRFLLSDEMQSSPSLHGPCVNRRGFEASAERYLKLYNDNSGGNVGREEYIRLLESWMQQVNAYDTSDPVIDEFFSEENGKFFDGRQSAGETARLLQAKIDKYLNE